jgi:hypothetical protein
MEGEMQTSGFLTVIKIETARAGHHITLVCRCTRLVKGSECGQLRHVRQHIFQQGKATMCMDCARRERRAKHVPRKVQRATGAPVDLQARIEQAYLQHLAKCAELRVGPTPFDTFLREICETPSLLAEYEQRVQPAEAIYSQRDYSQLYLACS